MSKSTSPNSHSDPTETSDCIHGRIDEPLSPSIYKNADKYDLDQFNYRSLARELAGEYLDSGFDDWRRLNRHLAIVARQALEAPPNELEDDLTLTTTRYNEKVILELEGYRNPLTLGSYSHSFRHDLPVHLETHRREFKNEFRRLFGMYVRKIITEVHKAMAWNGILPLA